MSIDERLDRLTERHEALSQSLELLTHDVHALLAAGQQDSERTRALEQTAATLVQTTGSLVQRTNTLVQTTSSLVQTSDTLVQTTGSRVLTAQQDGENIRGLARIAEIHERRLSDLEGQN